LAKLYKNKKDPFHLHNLNKSNVSKDLSQIIGVRIK
jgi:hypothetical protein